MCVCVMYLWGCTCVIYCRILVKYTQKPCESRACARGTLCFFLPQSWSRQGWDLDSALMGSLSQNGPSRLFLAFPLPWRLRRANQAAWRWCYMAWLMCVFGGTPIQTGPRWPRPGPALRPLGSGVSAFNSSIVWSRKCLPALRRTASTLMLIILFRNGAIQQSVIVWREVK